MSVSPVYEQSTECETWLHLQSGINITIIIIIVTTGDHMKMGEVSNNFATLQFFSPNFPIFLSFIRSEKAKFLNPGWGFFDKQADLPLFVQARYYVCWECWIQGWHEHDPLPQPTQQIFLKFMNDSKKLAKYRIGIALNGQRP